MIDDEERAVASALRARADAIRVPWSPLRRAQARPVRGMVAFASVAVMLAGAVLIGGALNARHQGAVASSAPGIRTALAPDATRLLVVDLGGQGIGLRTETDTVPFFRASGRAMLSYAVSADGRLAYWKTGLDDAPPHELHVYDPRTQTDRTVLTLTNERGGNAGFMVWSTDGTGLALSTSDANAAFEGPRAPHRPSISSWQLLDVATGASRTVATISDAWFVPVSWDRRTDVATATETGRDGPGQPTRRFYVFDQGRSKDTATAVLLPAAMDPWSVRTDAAARNALGLAPGVCGQAQCATLWTWPIEDPTLAGRHGPTDRYTQAAMFRPGTTNIFVLVRCVCDRTLSAPDITVEDWGTLGAATPRVVAHQAIGRVLFRTDGSALVVSPVDPNDRSGWLVDPDTGAMVPLPLQDDVLATVAPRATASSRSPLPSGVVDPRPLIAQATGLGSTVLRVDNVTAKLTTMSEFMRDAGATNPNISPGQAIWVVAIRGDVRIDAIIDLPHAQCALFAYDAAVGNVLGSRSGPASICDPYFN